MFKAFVNRNETTQDGKHSYDVSLGINGEDLLWMMPMSLQEVIQETEDEEVKDCFSKHNIVYLVAQKVVDITNLNDEEKKQELMEIVEKNFIDGGKNANR